jgi:hypothetical protein
MKGMYILQAYMILLMKHMAKKEGAHQGLINVGEVAFQRSTCFQQNARNAGMKGEAEMLTH